jgi:hypothetical protein
VDVRSVDVRADKVCSGEISTAEDRSSKNRSPQVRPAELRLDEVGSTRLAPLRSAPPRSALLIRGLYSLHRFHTPMSSPATACIRVSRCFLFVIDPPATMSDGFSVARRT